MWMPISSLLHVESLKFVEKQHPLKPAGDNLLRVIPVWELLESSISSADAKVFPIHLKNGQICLGNADVLMMARLYKFWNVGPGHLRVFCPRDSHSIIIPLHSTDIRHHPAVSSNQYCYVRVGVSITLAKRVETALFDWISVEIRLCTLGQWFVQLSKTDAFHM